MYNVEYSILCHYPSLISKDCISIAILFFNKDTRECRVKSVINWSRIQSFNDELDIELIKLQILGIKQEIHEIANEPNFALNDYTRFYVNTLKFSEVIKVKTDNFYDFVDECSRQYLIVDYVKEKRPSTNEQLKFIKTYLKNNDIEHINKSVNGYFNERIQFDFIIKDYAFKFFRFEDKKESRTIRFVKDWAYDAYKLKNKYKIVFITDIDFEDRNTYKTIYNILKEEAHKIITFKDALAFIQSI
jgi:hypothetical protein